MNCDNKKCQYFLDGECIDKEEFVSAGIDPTKSFFYEHEMCCRFCEGSQKVVD